MKPVQVPTCGLRRVSLSRLVQEQVLEKGQDSHHRSVHTRQVGIYTGKVQSRVPHTIESDQISGSEIQIEDPPLRDGGY